MVLGFKLNNQ